MLLAMGRAIGIDLGTTNSCVAVYDGKEARVIVSPTGSRTEPSVVAVTHDGRRMVGEVAKRQQVMNPTGTISSVKRLMGKRFSELPEDMEAITVPLSGNEHDRIDINLGQEVMSPEEVSAQILRHLKESAERVLGEEVTEAVITVPAYFNDAQRQATKDAGKIAGLEVKRIINEPTAAALSYGIDHDDDEQTILVFDLGGGTFDVSVMEIAEGSFFQVLATSGDNHLGGDDFDAAIVHWLVDKIKQSTGVDLSVDKKALQALYSAAETAKRELSSPDVSSASIMVPFIATGPEGAINVDETLTRAQFDQLVESLVDRLAGPTKQALADADLEAEDLDHVLLVGGMTRALTVQELVKRLTNKRPNQSINPDEAVAIGAAIQAYTLATGEGDVVLLDVLPLSLGLETRGGVMTKLIERNTSLPSFKTETFSTAEDNQPSVELHVLQGERDMAEDNRTLAKLHLLNIPPAPRGVPKIEVTFEVDADGILNIEAKDLGNPDNEIAQRIENGSGLDTTEISKMIADAERYAEEDRKQRELAELRNQAETLAYQAERMIRDQGDMMDATSREQLAVAAAEVRSTVEGSADVEDIKVATEHLMQVAHQVATELYKPETAAPAQASDVPMFEEPPEIIVDVEASVVDDDAENDQ